MATEESNINTLNDDCLFEVFSQLSLAEKCLSSRVNRRWHRVIKDLVSVSESLELTKEDDKFFSDQIGQVVFPPSELLDFVIGILLEGMKTFLRVLDVSDLTFEDVKHVTIKKSTLDPSNFKKLLLLFPSLNSIHLIEVKIKGLSQEENWKGLSELESFKDSFSITPFCEIKSFIRSCKSLKELKCERLDSNDINSLIELEILDCHVDNNEILEEILKQHPKLKRIVCFVRRYNDTFSKFVDLFPHFDAIKSLQEVDICYENRNRPKGPLSANDFVFESMKSLVVRNAILSAKDIHVCGVVEA